MTPEPFQSLSQHVQRQARLEAMFRKWHEVIKELPTFGEPPLFGSLKIGEIGADGLDANTFAVTLAGTTLYIRLDYRPGSEHGTDGVLQPYVLEEVTKDPSFLPPVAFKGTGETKFKTQLRDPANLDERSGAFVVIGELLKAALEHK